MNKEDRYSNRMSLPKDGMTLAKNDDILLRAVSEGQKKSKGRAYEDTLERLVDEIKAVVEIE